MELEAEKDYSNYAVKVSRKITEAKNNKFVRAFIK